MFGGYIGGVGGTGTGSTTIIINSGALTSGAVTSGYLGDLAVTSGNIAAGQVGSTHMAALAVRSGVIGSGAVGGFFGTRSVASGTVGSFDLGSGAVTAGSVGSGAVVSGNIASGQVGPFHLADGSVQSGEIASGAVFHLHVASGGIRAGNLASGSVGSGTLAVTETPDGTKFLRDDFTWQLAAVVSGSVGSGHLASGSVQGYYGNTRHVASGTVGLYDLGSGAVMVWQIASGAVLSGNISSGQVWTNHLANAAVRSGNIASGAVGVAHLASGSVRSGHLAAAGTPDGSKFLRDDFTWQAPDTAVVGSGDIGSGKVASGAIQGFYGVTRHLASGTVGSYDLGSGAVMAGQLGSGAVMSGAIASGQITTNHFASGTVIPHTQEVVPFYSGRLYTIDAEEPISGTRAVQVSPSGKLRIAMAGVSGRMPAIGVVQTDVLSGMPALVHSIGAYQFRSGLVDFSGYLGHTVYVGRSGHIVTLSGGWNSGGFLSGDYHQPAGVAYASGSALFEFAATLPFVPGLITSGNIASGQVADPHLAAATIYTYHIASGQIRSGNLGVTGTPTGAKFLRDDFSWQTAGAASIASGDVSSGKIASGAVQGFFGATRHLASGTVGSFDLGSGAVMAGAVGSGAVVSGNIASGQVARYHLASGAVGSGALAVTGTPDGSLFLRDDFSWQAAGSVLTSGVVQSGHLGNATVVSGSIASGQVWTYHLASGVTAGRAVTAAPFASSGHVTLVAEEPISGFRAVHMTQSGRARIAMASVSGRMPAIGVSVSPGQVASGDPVDVFVLGAFQLSSGMANFSGYLGQQLYVGRSGQIVSASGSWNSGGLLSGDVTQPIGFAWNSGAMLLTMAAQPPFVVGQLTSGDFASGQVDRYHLASGAASWGIRQVYTTAELISGVKAVAFASGNGDTVVRAERGSGLRLPAFGVTVSGAVSGTACEVVLLGNVYDGVSGMTASGFHGRLLYVGSGGLLTNLSGFMGGASSGAPWLSGDLQQSIGRAISGGVFVQPATFYSVSGAFQHTLPFPG